MFHDIGNNTSAMSLIDTAGINTSRVKNMSYMFHSNKWAIKKINLAGFDTSNVEDMSYMFGCYDNRQGWSLDPIDLSSFNTSKVTNMQGMFSNSYLPSIDIRHFDTSNVTDMRSMFMGLRKATSLDLSGLNVKKVSNIQDIFELDYNTNNSILQSLNLSGWELDSITSMYGLFKNLSELTNLNLNSFTTKNVTNMRYMFAGTKKLANLDLSSFDTSKVTTMERMFVGLAHLQNLNVSSFDTRNVTNMEAMFYFTFVSHPNGTLDLSSFDTHNLRRADGMFNYMKVKTIYASPNFITNNLTPNPSNIFMSNDNLVGGNGTTYTWPNYTSNFARIDTPGNPGYFTQKP